jgi:hypothetical protein
MSILRSRPLSAEIEQSWGDEWGVDSDESARMWWSTSSTYKGPFVLLDSSGTMAVHRSGDAGSEAGELSPGESSI